MGKSDNRIDNETSRIQIEYNHITTYLRICTEKKCREFVVTTDRNTKGVFSRNMRRESTMAILLFRKSCTEYYISGGTIYRRHLPSTKPGSRSAASVSRQFQT